MVTVEVSGERVRPGQARLEMKMEHGGLTLLQG